MVSEEKIFLSFSHYKFMEANDPRGVTSLDPRGLIGRIYEGSDLIIPGLVTNWTAKICCLGFILALFCSTMVIKNEFG